MQVRKAPLPGILIFQPKIFTDERGIFEETYHYRRYGELGLNASFVQDNHSHSKKNVVRGLHYQLKHPQGKLVYAVHGTVFDIAVDIRRGSPSFGQWIGIELSTENRLQVYIPPGFAHGFCVLSETADVLYKCTDYYVSEDDFGVLWNDPEIGVSWPVQEPIISTKDALLKPLSQIPPELLPIYAP